MATDGSRAVGFAIRGPIKRADLPGLCERVDNLLASSRRQVVDVDVAGVTSDAVTVDALARLHLGALRNSCRLRFVQAAPELLELLALMGLRDVIAAAAAAAAESGVEAERQAEQRKQ